MLDPQFTTVPERLIAIPLSKKKLLLTLLGAIGFVIIGFWFVLKPPAISNPVFGNPTVLFVLGLASILFFGLVAVIVVRKLVDNTPGLLINAEGFRDNSSGVSAGFVRWLDVEAIDVNQVVNQKFLMVIVRNP